MEHLHSGHRERVRQRIREHGLDSLQDHEVLEWILFHTIPREDVNALAHRLIYHFGSFHGVLEASFDELMFVDGIGKNTATFLSEFVSVTKRYRLSKEKQNLRKLRDLKDIVAYLRVLFATNPQESLHALFLDKEMHLIRHAVIAGGEFYQVKVDLRLLARETLNTNASYVVLAHNHPSEFVFPSAQDVTQTAEVATTLERIQVNLLDHVIVGKDEVFSMKESGEYSYLFF